ncbi:hypothetical protein D3C76_1097720 [compost metagenome]
MLGIVAVLHVGPGELAEVDSHFHIHRTVDAFADAIHVLARPFFPFRWRLAVAAEDDAFFEMHMHRVVPAVAAVLDFPHLQRTVAAVAAIGWSGGQLRRRVDPPRVHAVAEAAVGLDGPRRFVGAVGAAENELAMPGRL